MKNLRLRAIFAFVAAVVFLSGTPSGQTSESNPGAAKVQPNLTPGFACGNPASVFPSQTPYEGILDASDCPGTGGGVYDAYAFQMSSENAFVHFTLRSSQFQPSLTLYRSNGEIVKQDIESDGQATLGASNLLGQYILVVEPRSGAGFGNYQLTFSYIVIDIFPSPEFDFNGFGADYSVYRPSNNTWYLRQSGGGISTMQFGQPGDKIAPADYDGDGKTDIAIFRPSTGQWFIVQSQTQTIRVVNWGVDGDLPVPRNEYSSKADITVFRPANGTWYSILGLNSSISVIQWGQAGDKPVVGYFDGDHIGIFRPSEGRWYFRTGFLGQRTVDWGVAGDIPVPADYDGDGRTDIGVYRPSTVQWFLIKTRYHDIHIAAWGEPGDIPVPDDYMWDVRADLAVYRPSNSTWYITTFTLNSTSRFSVRFGEDGDIPLPSAFRY